MKYTDPSTAHYSTYDTTLAAWLIYNGFELVGLDRSNAFSVAFLFDHDGIHFSEAIKAFNQGTAEGNILAFFRAYKGLLLKLKNN